ILALGSSPETEVMLPAVEGDVGLPGCLVQAVGWLAGTSALHACGPSAIALDCVKPKFRSPGGTTELSRALDRTADRRQVSVTAIGEGTYDSERARGFEPLTSSLGRCKTGQRTAPPKTR